jgi:hypothetical protein
VALPGDVRRSAGDLRRAAIRRGGARAARDRVAAAGSTDGTAIRDALYAVSRNDADDALFRPGELGEALGHLHGGGGVDWLGASGPVDFDGFGGVRSPYEVWEHRRPMAGGACDSGRDFTRVATIPVTP